MMRPRPALAALCYPAMALIIAYASQWLGLKPCHLCTIQRILLAGAAGFAAVALIAPTWRSRVVMVATLLSAIAIIASGAVGMFHAGVEYGWWEYHSACTATARVAGDMLTAIMSAPLERCDVAQWSFGGLSMAGINALSSTVVGLGIIAWQFATTRRRAVSA